MKGEILRRAMSQENVAILKRGLEHTQATGDLLYEIHAPDLVWDMSKANWPERQVYEGIEGARQFLRDWMDSWDDWKFEAVTFHDAGEQVVAIIRQHGRSKATGLPIEMLFAQVSSFRAGIVTRIEMYTDPAEALEAAGLSE